ncbi:MAG: ATP-binding cassette domain-containing protein [Myxococcota bacterium]
MSGPVLEYADVVKNYGDFCALGGVSLAIPPGDVFGLLGPNGAGKTTLIRIGLDILRPDGGSVRLFGEDLRRQNLDRVSYLPESRGLYAKTTALDMLVYLGTLKGLRRGEAASRAMAWLQRFDLGFAATRNIDGLSKGMTQKVQLIGALLTEPELCVLDEPFSGLDPGSMQVVKELIEERRDAGLTTILSTHMMNQAQALCDGVAIVSGGAVVAEGTVAELRQQYTQQEVRIHAEGELPPIEGFSVSGADGAYTVTLGEGATVPAYLAAAVRAGAQVTRVAPVEPDLEQIFLRVTVARS